MLSGRSFPLRTREGEAASGRWGAGLCRACGIPRCCFRLIPLLTVTVEFALCYSQPPGASVVLSDALYAFRKTFLIQGPPFRLVTETDSSVLPLGCCAPCTCLWSERHWLFPPRVRWEPARLHPSGLSVSPLQCKMEFHACSTGKSLTTLCDGPCPCLPEPEPPKHKAEKNGEWASQGNP